MEQHVGLERQVGHVAHRLADDAHVDQRLGRDLAVGLRHALGHARGHLGGGVADVDLAHRDVVLAAVERRGLGEAGDGVLGGGVGDRIAGAARGRDRAVVDDAAALRRLRLHRPEGLLDAQEHAGQVGVDHALPLLQRQVFERRRAQRRRRRC